jgi:hypothetical protein
MRGFAGGGFRPAAPHAFRPGFGRRFFPGFTGFGPFYGAGFYPPAVTTVVEDVYDEGGGGEDGQSDVGCDASLPMTLPSTLPMTHTTAGMGHDPSQRGDSFGLEGHPPVGSGPYASFGIEGHPGAMFGGELSAATSLRTSLPGSLPGSMHASDFGIEGNPRFDFGIEGTPLFDFAGEETQFGIGTVIPSSGVKKPSSFTSNDIEVPQADMGWDPWTWRGAPREWRRFQQFPQHGDWNARPQPPFEDPLRHFADAAWHIDH